jgi:hypothetical protein
MRTAQVSLDFSGIGVCLRADVWSPSVCLGSDVNTDDSFPRLRVWLEIYCAGNPQTGISRPVICCSINTCHRQTDTSCTPRRSYQTLYFSFGRFFHVRKRIDRFFAIAANGFDAKNIRGWPHVLIVNIPCSLLHSFCASGMSSGLATRVKLSTVSRGRLGESATWGGLLISLGVAF